MSDTHEQSSKEEAPAASGRRPWATAIAILVGLSPLAASMLWSLEEVHERVPDSVIEANAVRAEGVRLSRRGESAEAVKRYQRALELDPGSAETHYRFATLLGSMGESEAAIVHFERALALRPNHA